MKPILLVLALLGACHRTPTAPTGEEALASADKAVREFFARSEAGDCKKVRPLMLKPNGCENLVRQFQETHTRLKALSAARHDGRSERAVLIDATVEFEDREHYWIVRAEWKDGAWRMSL